MMPGDDPTASEHPTLPLPPRPVRPSQGRTLLGSVVAHYRVLAKLGGGSMGVVYRARDLKLGRAVALKFLPRELTRDSDARERFLQEARAASGLDHPNICTIHEIRETVDDQIFIAMTCYEGETLKQKIQRGPLAVPRAVNTARCLASGLARAHAAGVVHRDIKPANIFVTNDEQVKILDFGLAKLADRSRISQRGMLVGTVGYMAPEQVSGGPVDHRIDIWALGVVLYEMITGRLPFGGHGENAIIYGILHDQPPPPSALVADIPVGLEQIIQKALAKDPDERFPHMAAIIDALADPLDGLQPASNRPRSIAVLPLANMSADPEQEYFCDGMAEEIINSLSGISELRVLARTSTFAFKGKSVDVRQIGNLLGVDTLLEGGVRKVGSRLRITVQLIDVSRGYQFWSGRYDRELADVFAVQEEIAQNIVRALRGRAGPQLRPRPTADVQAYDLYLRGRELFYQLTRRGLQFARQTFKRAAEFDSGYVPAYAGAADCCSLLCMWFERTPELLAEAESMSRRAVELAPDLAQAHASRGMALSMNRKYEEASAEFGQAIQLDPNLFEAYYFYARSCAAQGDIARAADLYRRANRARPEDYQSLFLGSQCYRGLGRQTEAREMALLGIETAERHLDLFPDDTRALYLGAAALVVYGDRERGLQWARQAAELDPEQEGMLYQLACIHSLAGDLEQAIDHLERWEKEGALPRDWLEHDSDLDPLRQHPRFQALMGRLA